MKSIRPPLATIFFMTYFHRAGGGAMAPSAPPWIRYCKEVGTPCNLIVIFKEFVNRMLFLLQPEFYNFVVNEFVLGILVLVSCISGPPLLGLDASTQ